MGNVRTWLTRLLLSVAIGSPAVAAANVELTSMELPYCGSALEKSRGHAAILSPADGKEIEVEVGSRMFLQTSVTVAQHGIRVDREVSVKGKYKDKEYTITVAPITLHQSDVVNHSYALPSGSLKFADEAFGKRTRPPKLGVIDDSDGTRFVALVQFGSFGDGFDLPPDALTELRCIIPNQIGFSREILYGGVVKGVVTLQYRESDNGQARPAFSQEGHFDLSDGSEVAFKGVRMKILSATNTGIRYIILSVRQD